MWTDRASVGVILLHDERKEQSPNGMVEGEYEQISKSAWTRAATISSNGINQHGLRHGHVG